MLFQKPSSKLKIGDKAPQFTLKNSSGQNVSLSDFEGKQNIVLYFYPKDETPGCTAQACSFRDHYEDFRELGAEVIGVSSDSTSSHESFSQNHKLPFVLLSDPGDVVAKRYGVEKTLGILKGRVTFVIDKNGTIVHIFNSAIQFTRHIDEAKDALKKLK
jgi:peroxiredoxin Q/BCP